MSIVSMIWILKNFWGNLESLQVYRTAATPFTAGNAVQSRGNHERCHALLDLFVASTLLRATPQHKVEPLSYWIVFERSSVKRRQVPATLQARAKAPVPAERVPFLTGPILTAQHYLWNSSHKLCPESSPPQQSSKL